MKLSFFPSDRRHRHRHFKHAFAWLGFLFAIFLVNLCGEYTSYITGDSTIPGASKSIPNNADNRRKWTTDLAFVSASADETPSKHATTTTRLYSLQTMATQTVCMRSSTSTVMGFATGYEIHVFGRFVGSLRWTGFSGHIILAVSPDLDSETETYLLEKNVTLKRVEYIQCTNPILNASDPLAAGTHGKEILTCISPYGNLKARWGRFPFLRDALEECAECTGNVFISDVRDTFFQRDPFGDDAPTIDAGTVHVFEEDLRIRTTSWLVEWPVRECKHTGFDHPMLCSGTTIGTRQGMLQYLQVVYNEMQVWMEDPNCHFKINGDDQSIHNYLFYTGRLPFARAIPNRMGTVNTVGAQAIAVKKDHEEYTKSKRIGEAEAKVYPYQGTNLTQGKWLADKYGLTDQQGYFANEDGKRSFVVHQYDRFGYQLERWFWRFPGFKD